MTTKEIIASIIGAGGLGAIIAWIRGRKIDSADVAKKLAEKETILSDGAYKLLDRISIECDVYKDKVDNLLMIVKETELLLQKAKANNLVEVAGLTRKLREVEDELIALKEKNCKENKQEAERLVDGLNKLKK